MRNYKGKRMEIGVSVVAIDMEDGKIKLMTTLGPKASQLVRNHSPDGFDWGYAGSGPAQLALAILLDYLTNLDRGDEDAARHFAQRNYQTFKADVVAIMPSGGWEITGPEIEQWIEARESSAAYFRAKWDGAPMPAQEVKDDQDEFKRKFNQGGWDAV